MKKKKSPNLDRRHLHMTDSLSSHASRHRLQVKNTPTAATSHPRQNISISVDGICLGPRDPSGAGCHVSGCPVWEPAQPKGLLSRGNEEGGGTTSPLATLTSGSGRGLPSRPGWSKRRKKGFTYRMSVVMFDACGPRSGIASSSLWFSFLCT